MIQENGSHRHDKGQFSCHGMRYNVVRQGRLLLPVCTRKHSPMLICDSENRPLCRIVAVVED